MNLLIALLAVIVPAAAFAHEAPQARAERPDLTPEVNEAARVVEQFHDALSKGDATAAQILLDDAVQIYEQGWVERSKAEYAEHHLQSDIAFSASTKRVRRAGSGTAQGDLAYITSEATVIGTFGGKPINSITLETMVLRRAGQGWRIVHIHWSSRDSGK
jgi:ketosteroid isomerase-like protein